MRSGFTRILATGALATALACGMAPSSQAMPLPVTSVQEIAGAAPTEPVYWRGYGWRGYGWGYRRAYYGWGWRRPYYGWGWRRPYRAYYPAYYRPYRRVYYRPVYYRPFVYR